MRIAISVEIQAPVERVFYWLGDPQRAVTWMTSVSSTEIIEKTPDWVGTTFRETVAEQGQSTELHGVVVDYVPEKRLAFHLEGTYNTVDVTYTLQDRGAVTELSQVAEVRFKGLTRRSRYGQIRTPRPSDCGELYGG